MRDFEQLQNTHSWNPTDSLNYPVFQKQAIVNDLEQAELIDRVFQEVLL